ncbi:helix-turn-helix domain-containing protein [Roseovarius sp. D0-M9]|uniref:helix-turn-helix domain-containing protein n=1 Tax=Roseovarius sp. D0-M9 TaxID=3127117 RepID=UPI00300FDBD8
MHDTTNQTQRILAHLKAGKSIDPMEALREFGCFRLGARIYYLKQDGHRIESERVPTDSGKLVAQYRLIKQAEARPK